MRNGKVNHSMTRQTDGHGVFLCLGTDGDFFFRYKQLLRLSRINARLLAQVSDVASFTGWVEA
jgi:hypothetical protein